MDSSLFNDIHRDLYIHNCEKCNSNEVKSYRDCTGETHSRECDGKLKKIDFVALTPYSFKFDKHTCLPIVGRTFFDVTTGQEISTSDINKICKERGLVYGNDKDLSKDCERNRKHTEEKQMNEFRNTVIENTMRELT
jgi:hypothetical protein